MWLSVRQRGLYPRKSCRQGKGQFLRETFIPQGLYTGARDSPTPQQNCDLLSSTLSSLPNSHYFSTSSTACARPRKKKTVVKTTKFIPTSPEVKANQVVEELLDPKPKLKLIGSSKSTQEISLSLQSPLLEAIKTHAKLEAKYYELLNAEDSICWMTIDELKGVSANSMAKWVQTPRRNHNYKSRVGLMRRHGDVLSVAAAAKNVATRKILTEWDENACAHLAAAFHKLLILRATIARLSGFDNYVEYKAEHKMMDREAAEILLSDLREHMAPSIISWMGNLLAMKLQDMDDKITPAARRDLNDLSIWEFQRKWPEYRLHWGDVHYYSRLQNSKKVQDSPYGELYGYFPTETTVRKLLKTFGYVSGMSFVEVLPNDERYAHYIATYKSHPETSGKVELEEKLPVFIVLDSSSWSSANVLGILVLDLLQRPGKRHGAQCRHFGYFTGTGNTMKTAGHVIICEFEQPSRNRPSCLAQHELQTIAHELGHAIHRFALGVGKNVPRDSIKIPSILLENWVLNPQFLQNLSSPHFIYDDESWMKAWKEGYDMIPPRKASIKSFDSVSFHQHPGSKISYCLKLMWQSKFDLTIHSYSLEELQSIDLATECQKVLKDWTGVFGTGKGDDAQKNMAYLGWASLQNYNTVCYCYLLAEIYTVDIYQRFFAKKPMNRKEGIRFRKTVLEHSDHFTSKTAAIEFKKDPMNRFKLYLELWRSGRYENTMDALEKYMGRKLSTKAFVKALRAPTKKRSFWTRVAIKLRIKGIMV